MPWREDYYPFARGSHGWRMAGGRPPFGGFLSPSPLLHLGFLSPFSTFKWFWVWNKRLSFVSSDYYYFLNHRTLSLEIEKGRRKGWRTNSSSRSLMVPSELFLLVYTSLPVGWKFEEALSVFAQMHFHSGLDFPLDCPHFMLINLRLLSEIEDTLGFCSFPLNCWHCGIF